MSDWISLLKAFILGVVQGITEWLPISSTGHLILADVYIRLDASDAFKEMFFVVIQLGAILAVVVLYWQKLFPFEKGQGLRFKRDTLSLWGKILIACVPAGIVGITLDDRIDALFYNPPTVAIMLIVFGLLFIIVEKRNRRTDPIITDTAHITPMAALIIGAWQLIAAVFPGTSRSGATIIGALLLGISRATAAEFTFLLAVPVMLGASALKLLKFGFSYSQAELSMLAVGVVTAFAVSIVTIKGLMSYIRKHDFVPFGWYRIALGLIVIVLYATAVLK